MPDPLTSTLRLTEPQIGGDTGLWAGYLNNNLIFSDQGVNQALSIAIADTNITPVADGTTSDQARYQTMNFTGALTAARTVTLPNVQRQGWAANSTTGGFNVILSTGAGTTVTLPPDGVMRFYKSDGATNIALPSVGFGNVWHKINQAVVSGLVSQAMTMPTVFQRFRVTAEGVTFGTAGAGLVVQVSSDGGATYYSTNQYQYAGWFSDSSGASSAIGTGAAGFVALSGGIAASAAQALDATLEVWPGTVSLRPTFRASSYGFGSDSLFRQGVVGGSINVAAVMNAIRIGASTGTFSGTLILEALP
jgi:hypothetical protein